MSNFIVILSLSILFNDKYDLEPITLMLSKFIMFISSYYYDITLLGMITLFPKSGYYSLNKIRNVTLFIAFIYYFYSEDITIDEKLVFNLEPSSIMRYIVDFCFSLPIFYAIKKIHLLYDNRFKRYIDTIKGSYITDTIYAFLLYEKQSLNLEDMFIYSLFLEIYLSVNFSSFYYYFFIIGIFNIENTLIISMMNYIVHIYGVLPCIPLFLVFQYL